MSATPAPQTSTRGEKLVSIGVFSGRERFVPEAFAAESIRTLTLLSAKK